MLTVQEQIYGLSQIWCEAKYNFVFWNQRKNIDWDSEYQKSLRIVSKPMEIIDYYLELMRFISLLNDGHTHVDFPKEIYKQIKSLPIKIKYSDNKHFISNVADGYDIPLLCEILEINGENFDKYMNEKILPYCWNINKLSSYEHIYSLENIPRDADKNAYGFIPIIERNKPIKIKTTSGTFEITPDDKEHKWSAPTNLKCREKLSIIFDSESFSIQISKDNIAIITIKTFMDDDMPNNFYKSANQLSDVKGFIIDIRNNGGGHSSNAEMLSQAFIKGELQCGKVKHAKYIGAYKAWAFDEDLETLDLSNEFNKKIYDICNQNLFEEYTEKYFDPDCPITFDQPVVILENSGTGSSSENMLLIFDNANRATIVGTPSYGTTGNPLFVPLPGNGMARICTRRYTYPNDKEFINIGIQPHIYAELSLNDLITGTDSVLDKGLSILRSMK